MSHNKKIYVTGTPEDIFASADPVDAFSEVEPVYVAIALDTPRRLDQVLSGYSLQPGGYAFERTEVPLQLLAHGQVLASRAEARRALARLQQFRRADINFAGIQDVGQGFADEMFRVFRRRHPEVELVPQGMTPQVAAMVAAACAT